MATTSIFQADDFFLGKNFKQVKEPMEKIGISEFINKLISNPTGSTVKTHRFVQDASLLNHIIETMFSKPKISAFRETFLDTKDYWFMKQSIWMKRKTFWDNSQADYYSVKYTTLEKSCITYKEISYAKQSLFDDFVRAVNVQLNLPEEFELKDVADFLVVRTVYELTANSTIKLAVEVVEFGGEVFTLVAISGPGNAFNSIQDISNASTSTEPPSIVRSKIVEYLHRKLPKVYADLQTQPNYADYTLNSKMITFFHPESSRCAYHPETIARFRKDINSAWNEALDEFEMIDKERPELGLAWVILIKACIMGCPPPMAVHYSINMNELSIEWSLQGIYFSVTDASNYSINVHQHGRYSHTCVGSLNNASYDRSDIEKHVAGIKTNKF